MIQCESVLDVADNSGAQAARGEVLATSDPDKAAAADTRLVELDAQTLVRAPLRAQRAPQPIPVRGRRIE